MKVRDQMALNDGFEKNVAEKMPNVKKEENFQAPILENRFQAPREEPVVTPPEKELERPTRASSPPKPAEKELPLDVLKLVEDLHTQLLASSQTKRALETDLFSSKKTIQQLIQDNKELRSQLDESKRELQTFREINSEALYLKEENADALEKIRGFQQELKEIKASLAKVTQERDDAFQRMRDLESQMEQSDVFRIMGKLKEREASYFAEENRELQSRLEEVQLENMDLEQKYEEIRKSFNEVRESLALLRDSAKMSYYNLSESSG